MPRWSPLDPPAPATAVRIIVLVPTRALDDEEVLREEVDLTDEVVRLPAPP